MDIGIVHLAGAIIAALLLMGIISCFLVRKARAAYPVKCIHCAFKLNRETIVTYSEKPGQWAICPECVREYWNITLPKNSSPEKTAPKSRISKLPRQENRLLK